MKEDFKKITYWIFFLSEFTINQRHEKYCYNYESHSSIKTSNSKGEFIKNLLTERLLHPKHAQFKGMGKIKISQI